MKSFYVCFVFSFSQCLCVVAEDPIGSSNKLSSLAPGAFLVDVVSHVQSTERESCDTDTHDCVRE